MSDLTFDGFLRALGLRPGAVVPDMKWRRCSTESHPRKKNGAYRLSLDGKMGWGKDWTVMSEYARWHADQTDDDMAAYDPEAMAVARREWASEEGRRRHYAREAVRAFYNAAEPLDQFVARANAQHQYLADHGLGVRGTWGIKVDSDGWLVVPMYIGNVLASVQRIAPDGEKLYWKGAPMQEASIAFTRPVSTPTITILCEGVATGLALYEAVPNSRVICCFDAGNLERTTHRPLGLVVIGADNDYATHQRMIERGQPDPHNPGLRAATRAAEALGAGVAAPEGITGSDWCDYRVEGVAARLKRKHDFQTRAQMQMAVDGEIRARVMAAARYVGSDLEVAL